MKFFITGSIRSKKGPRTILSFTLLFFLLFLIMNLVLLFEQTGLLPGRIVELYEPSVVMRMERTHIQMFLLTMIYVITASIFIRTRIDQPFGGIVLVIGALLTLAYFISYPIMVSADSWVVYLYSASTISIHVWYTLLIGYIFLDLRRQDALERNESGED